MSHHIFPKARATKKLISYLVNFVPICCLSSSLSSSVCIGRMFFSSNSRLEGLLLSLIAKESFLQTFIAREPVGERRGSAKRAVIISFQHTTGKEVAGKGGCYILIYTVWTVGKGASINIWFSVSLNSCHNTERMNFVVTQENEYCSAEGNRE